MTARRRVIFTRPDPGTRAKRESQLGLGNGWLFVRDCPPEAAFGALAGCAQHPPYPGLYAAGFHDRSPRTVAGERARVAALVRLPDPFGLSFRIGREAAWFGEGAGELLGYRRVLDFEAGTCTRSFTLRDARGRSTRLHETRCVSLADPRLALLRWRIEPLDWSATASFVARLQTTATNGRVAQLAAYEGVHLEARPAAVEVGTAVDVRTLDGADGLRISTRLDVPDARRRAAPAPARAGDPLEQRAERMLRRGEAIEVALWVRVSRDPSDTLSAAARADDVLHAQRRAWAAAWPAADIEAPADARLERGCRFAAFHLLQAAAPDTPVEAGLPARGWQEAYLGHVFWDEMFAFGFYALRWPQVARRMLAYRWQRLGRAREAAACAGFEGALFPWRSARGGEEETPPLEWIPPARNWRPDATFLERHVGAAIAFNLWQYHLATDDRATLVEHTGPMLVEIARFWASAVVEGDDGRCGILGVMGPDEYHDRYPWATGPGLDDNAYTNAMAAWTLHRAATLREHLRPAEWRALRERCGVDAAQARRWLDLAARLRIPFLGGGLIAQFDGFDTLLPARADGVARGSGQREDWVLAARGDDVNRYQVMKQADAATLFHLLGDHGVCELIGRMGYAPPPGWQRRTVEHYLARLSHESSLSHLVCAGALADDEPARSWRFFRRALQLDLDGGTGTEEGLHLGAMGGAWDVLQRHYLGAWLEPDGLRLRPRLPPALDELAMRLRYRGQALRLRLRGRRLEIRHEDAGGEGVRLLLADGPFTLAAGRSLSLAVR